ncbi:MAG: Hpt domain-containing protein [Candidatus Marinimicrobia bacterium]|nr:Hpt domain-containing protein [FCB group bacterium]MBL7025877.1 Hpt domain-containing protein [Candidatus Neomarinimicrobiota bacterium]
MDEHVDKSNISGDIDPLFLSRLEDLGGSKLATELVDMYLIRGYQLLEAIAAGFAAQDFSVVKNAAHSLISSAGNLGGKKVSTLAKLIEAEAIEEQLDQLPELLVNLRAAQKAFQQYLRGAIEKI